MSNLLSLLIQFVIMTCARYNIDESHGLTHSMDILHYTNDIYESELMKHPSLKSQEKVIYVSSVIHDMCDKKYMNEDEGIENIEQFLKKKMKKDEINTIKKIISTMSYSKVMKNGFGRFDTSEEQLAYHIVREADLLTAYDFDRCMIYHISKQENIDNIDMVSTYNNAWVIFQNRVFKHNENGLFLTEYSKTHSKQLEYVAMQRINSWKKILRKVK